MYEYLTFEEELNRKRIKGRVLKVLEFDKITIKLSSFARTSYGRAHVENLVPISDYKEVSESLNDTYDAYRFISKCGSIPIGGFPDIINILSYVKAGGTLSMGELLDVSSFLYHIVELKKVISSDTSEFLETRLFQLIGSLNECSSLHKEISLAINSEDEMNDRASMELYRIRKEIKDVSASIRVILNRILKNNEDILQEKIITIRKDRYCVPLQASMKSRLPGIVHDTSSTGQTIFVEPMSVVEANNKLSELFALERLEIERILILLTNQVSKNLELINQDIANIGIIDFISSKGELGNDMNATMPVLNTDGVVRLNKARHPLIDKDKVVPVDIVLGVDYRTLVVTGPNTGGKTVSLKTCGLMTLMTMAGLMIPCGAGTEVSIFDRVLADIGDEQSIEQSLSTFSAHISNIVFITKNIRGRSLVLLDELGSGTDPQEGSALAIAILDYLFEKHAVTMATTHYKELKSYSISKPGVMNASCEFDVETLSPTYRLIIGEMGASNAFLISSKLGLNKKIIEEAKKNLSMDELSYERLLDDANRSSKRAKKLEEENKRLNASLKSEISRLEEEKTKLKESKTRILNELRREQKKLLSEKEEELSLLIKEVKQKTDEDSKNVREEELNKIRRRLRAGIKDLSSDDEDYKLENVALPGEAPTKVELNELYYVPHLDGVGKIVSKPNGRGKKVIIEVSGVRYNLDTSLLREPQASNLANMKRENNSVSNKKTSPTKIRLEKAMVIRSELMLIGLRAYEAESRLLKYIDDSCLAGIKTVRIVHGKGTGALREMVVSILSSDHRVESYRAGLDGEGGDGVTIATFY